MMNTIIILKKIYNKLLKLTKKTNFLKKNKKNKIKKCYICGEEFENFYKYPIQNENAVNFFKIIGSDVTNYGCYYCDSNDRERHLYMFFDKLHIWSKFKNSKILHFAPEKSLANKINQLEPNEYIKCDLYPKEDWIKINITKIDYENEYFDILICNHVIEHISDQLQALKEISRVLKKNGFAILQTPYTELLYNHFEDQYINTDELKLSFYGQEDHVRIVSKRQFFDELSQTFTLNIMENTNYFSKEECYKYGVNYKEDLIMVIKK